jgi:ADP-ribose pyrophosphatase YjhB (NUDIX family)
MLGVGAEIVDPDGRLLRIEQERMGVVEWSSVGGALEDGESILDGVAREALEESGLEVRVERLIRVSEFREGETFVGVGFLFLARPDPWPQEVRLPEADGLTRFRSYRWLDRAEAERLDGRWAHDITRTAWPTDIVEVIIDRIEGTPMPRIRRARPSEADELSSLAERSKAHWGYDAEFMERARVELSLGADAIAEHDVWVLEDAGGGDVVGWHRVIHGEPAILEDLWLDPSAIGSGHGRRLWEHAVSVARAGGASVMELDADPNAVGFYERMGAQVVGETPSRIAPGRTLPRMRIKL